MSRIYFGDRNGRVELWGPERAHMDSVCRHFALAFFYPLMDHDHDPSTLWPLLGGKKDWPQPLEQYLNIFVAGHFDGYFHIGKRRIYAWHTVLNTAMLLGNPIHQLFARIHAQCEVHGWFSGEDRWCLAKTIEEGRGLNMMRVGMGWGKVHDFLLQDDKEPVVMSYSVCDEFPYAPSSWYAEHDEDDEDDAKWYDLTDEERWDIAFAELKKIPSLQIRYENGRWDYDTEDQLYFALDGDPWVYTTADIKAIADQEQQRLAKIERRQWDEEYKRKRAEMAAKEAAGQ